MTSNKKKVSLLEALTLEVDRVRTEKRCKIQKALDMLDDADRARSNRS